MSKFLDINELAPINYESIEDRFIGDFMKTKLHREITEKDIKECSSEYVCEVMTKLLSNDYDPELSIITSDLRFDKYDRPTIQVEIKMSNCKTIEQVTEVRKKLLQMIDDSVKYINDYGYKEGK